MRIYIIDGSETNIKKCIYINLQNSKYQLINLIKDNPDKDFNYKVLECANKDVIDTSNFDFETYDESNKILIYKKRPDFFNGVNLLSTYNYTLNNFIPQTNPEYLINDNDIVLVDAKYIDNDKLNSIESFANDVDYSDDIKIYNDIDIPHFNYNNSTIIKLNVSCEVTLIDLYKKKGMVIRIPSGTTIDSIGIEKNNYFFYDKSIVNLVKDKLNVNISQIIKNKKYCISTKNDCIVSNCFIVVNSINYKEMDCFIKKFFDNFSNLFYIKEFNL